MITDETEVFRVKINGRHINLNVRKSFIPKLEKRAKELGLTSIELLEKKLDGCADIERTH